jgi:polyhydroxybutyrate depolymerase
MNGCLLQRVRWFLGLYVIIAAVWLAASASAQETKETITVDSLDRTYTIHLPKGYDEKQHYPVVLLLHGVNQEADDMERLTRFNELADKDSIIAVYPNALHGRWNFGVHEPTQQYVQRGPYRRRWPGPGYPPPPPRNPEGGQRRREAPPAPADDIEFFNKLLDKIANKYSVDQSRVYATGLSDGGFMATKVGCAMADRIAAVGPVAAAMPKTMVCLPARPIPVLMINGTDDPIVKYDGASAKPGRIATISVEDSAKEFAKLNHCSEKPSHSKVRAHEKGGKDTEIATFEGCQQNASVVLYSVKGGGNAWPGGQQYEVEKQIGKTSNDLDANEVLWSFFVTKKLPEAGAAQK